MTSLNRLSFRALSNKSRFNAIFSTIILLLFYRALIPYGDEPDFSIKSLLFSDGALAVFFGELPENNCMVSFDAFAIFGKIDFATCFLPKLDLWLWLKLSLYVSATAAFTMFFICTRNRALIGVDKCKHHCAGWPDIVLLSLSFPGLLYYTALMSNEALFVLSALAMMASIFSRFSYVFLALCAYIDFGNFIVLFFFFCLFKFFLIFENFFRSKTIWLVPLFVVALYPARDSLFHLLSSVLANDWITHLYETLYLSEGSYNELLYKYTLPLRYANTFATGIFMTPSGLKSPVLYFFVLVFFFVLIVNYRRLRNTLSGNVTNFHLQINPAHIRERILLPGFSASILTILLTILFLPTFSNAKYYIFTLPVFLGFFVIYWGFKKVFLSIIFLNATVFFWILISYL
jgi:hypothetical protein